MKPQDFSWISAALTVLCLVVGAIVALFQTKKISHERLQEAVKDLASANEAKGELAKVLEDRIKQLQDDLVTTTLRVGDAEKRNERRMRRIMALEEYRDTLIDLLTLHQIPVPPEPKP
jgi:F0F1-type ATP synthase membrane subunit b/b'